MASNLRVDTILPSSGTNVAIGTASGTVSLVGNSNLTTTGNLTIGGNLGIGGTLTYEDVTNIDSVGIITARSGIRIAAGSTVGPVSAVIVSAAGNLNEVLVSPVWTIESAIETAALAVIIPTESILVTSSYVNVPPIVT